MLPLVAMLGLIAGGYCVFTAAKRWDSGLHLVLIATLFGGIVAVNLGSGAYLVLFRDIFIVLPLYVGFLAHRSGQAAIGRIPADLFLALMLLLAAIVLALFSPADAPALQIVIGLKVWVYYIPFVALGVALAADHSKLYRFLRQFLIWGLIAAGIGLAQSLLVRVVGYERAIGWFFGSHADAVTQGFSGFEVAGGIYRIPGTFSFVSQYAAFLHIYIAIAVIEANIERDARFRQLAYIGLFVGVMASLLSGAREAIIFTPATLLVYILCGLLNVRLLLLLPIGLAAGIVLLRFSHLDLVSYFFYGTNLASEYWGDFIWQELSAGFDYGVLGAGIGSSTTAARYAVAGVTGGFGDIATQVGLESSYGKAAAELGWLGFISMALIMATLAIRSLHAMLRSWGGGFFRIIAPLAIYLLYNVVVSFKGYVLDIDPPNIMIWLSLGIMIELARQRTVPVLTSELDAEDSYEDSGGWVDADNPSHLS